MSTDTLRSDALTIFKKALLAVDPAEAIRRTVIRSDDHLYIDDLEYNLHEINRIFIIGTGKAGALMAQTLENLLGDHLEAGYVNVKYDHVVPVRLVHLQEAGHPIPDTQGVEGAENIVELLTDLKENDLVFCVISGGGSALLPLPVDGVTLAEKQMATQMLLDCGATINELNTIRKHISQVKGGQLARLAAPASVISLILSDVIGDPLDIIASGPTVPDTSTFDDCEQIINRYNLQDRLPDRIAEYLKSGRSGQVPDTPKPGDAIFDRVHNVLIATNIRALEAARSSAEALGYQAMILSSSIEGETREIAKVYSALAQEIQTTGHPVIPPVCIISGGETTVTIRGPGKGGRNQEFVLAAALGIDGMQNTVVFSAGTDGTDGPTDAAGAIADGHTIKRADGIGIHAETLLNQNDSYNFFQPLNDLIITGPTNTNVMDLRLLLVGKD